MTTCLCCATESEVPLDLLKMFETPKSFDHDLSSVMIELSEKGLVEIWLDETEIVMMAKITEKGKQLI